MSSYTPIYKKTQEFVSELFRANHPHHLVFHNLQHTAGVVKKVNEISGHYKLSDEDMLVVFVAAWFHDTGYLFVSAEEHEKKSVEQMQDFMKQFGLPHEITDKIGACIMATRFPRNPQNALEEIICDADTYQFGNKKNFPFPISWLLMKRCTKAVSCLPGKNLMKEL